MTTGICPFASWIPSQNFGYNGPGEINQPLGFADHIAAGPKSSLDAAVRSNGHWVWIAAGQWAQASAHACIGKDGSLSQYVNIYDAAWAQGIYDDPGIQMGNPFIAAAMARAVRVGRTGNQLYAVDANGANVLNLAFRSTEHDGQPGDVWTPEELAADIAWKTWILAEDARVGVGFSMDSIDRLIGHNYVDPVNRSQCPGPHWPRQAIFDAISASAGPVQDLIQAGQNAVDNWEAAIKLIRNGIADIDGFTPTPDNRQILSDFANARHHAWNAISELRQGEENARH